MPSANLLDAVRRYCRALDAERIEMTAALTAGDPERNIGARKELMAAEHELRVAASEADRSQGS